MHRFFNSAGYIKYLNNIFKKFCRFLTSCYSPLTWKSFHSEKILRHFVVFANFFASSFWLFYFSVFLIKSLINAKSFISLHFLTFFSLISVMFQLIRFLKSYTFDTVRINSLILVQLRNALFETHHELSTEF